jgi:hypothetical protein
VRWAAVTADVMAENLAETKVVDWAAWTAALMVALSGLRRVATMVLKMAG